MNLFRKKPLTNTASTGESKSSLKKVLGPFDLTALGVGAIIGTGIFVLTGVVAAKDAGPGILVSFVLAGIACFLQHFATQNWRPLYRWLGARTLRSVNSSHGF